MKKLTAEEYHAGISYGAEYEWADIDKRKELPMGTTYDTDDHDVVNTNGRAVDPTNRYYHFGGEINTKPCKTMDETNELFDELISIFPEARSNYRCYLHLHVKHEWIEDIDNLK